MSIQERQPKGYYSLANELAIMMDIFLSTIEPGPRVVVAASFQQNSEEIVPHTGNTEVSLAPSSSC